MWQYLAGLRQGSSEDYMFLVSNKRCCFSHSQDSQVKNQKVGILMSPPTITSSNPLAKFILSLPMTLCSVDLEMLVLERRMLPPEKPAMILLNWKLGLLPRPLVSSFFCTKRQRKGLLCRLQRFILTTEGEIVPQLYNESKQEHV